MWIARCYRSAKAWYGRRSWLSKILVGSALLASPCWCCIGAASVRNTYNYWFTYTDEDRAFFRNRGEYQEGVPSVARRLKAEMEPLTDPDEALRQNPDWVVVRFPNGEWVFGYGYDSHGFRVGHGTLVLKDSRGRVRVFFGHVCGTNAGIEWLSRSNPLDGVESFYATLARDQPYLREWVPPP